jgi:4-hydroxy-2-oxoheptanedioate aldolase
MQASLEYDFAFFCNEHMPVDRTETAMMCQFYASRGISPVVRIPRAQAHFATMALDGGAQGIVAPYVETDGRRTPG